MNCWNFVSYSQRDQLEDKNQDAPDKVKIRIYAEKVKHLNRCSWSEYQMQSVEMLKTKRAEFLFT